MKRGMADECTLVSVKTRALATLVALAVAAALGPGEVVRGEATTATTTIGVPERVNEYASIVSRQMWVALAWAASSDASGTDIYAAVSRDGGASFGSPVRVNTVAKQASVNGEQPPRIAIVPGSGGPALVVVWTAKGESGTVILSARSSDGGRSFAASMPVPGSDAAGNRGWESVAVDPAIGRIYTAWLDHRDSAGQAGGAHAAHQH